MFKSNSYFEQKLWQHCKQGIWTWAHSGMCDTVLIGTIVIVLLVLGAKKTSQELLMLRAFSLLITLIKNVAKVITL